MIKTLKRNHKKITRKSARNICFFASAFIITIFLIVIALSTTNYVINNAKEMRQKTSEALVHEYALVSKYMLNSARTELKQFSTSVHLINSTTPEEVSEYFNVYAPKYPDYVPKLSFMFLDGVSVLNNGEIVNIKDSKLYNSILSEKNKSMFYGPFKSFIGESDYICATSKVYKDGVLKGIIVGRIDLEELHRITKKMNIKNDGHFFIVGDDGKFVCHDVFDLLGKSCNVKDNYYVDVEPQDVVGVSGVADTISYDNKETTVYFENIEGTNWVCGVTVDKQTVNMLNRRLLLSVVYVGLGTLVLILILFCVSFLILNNVNLFENSIDPLTQMWTRPKFEKAAQEIIEKHKGERFAIIEADYPGFKFINRLHGVEAGDTLLKKTGQLIFEKVVQRGDICARGYADHFYILCKIDSIENFLCEFEQLRTFVDSQLAEDEFVVHLKSGITFLIPDSQFYSQPRKILELIGEASYAKSTVKNDLLHWFAIYSIQMQTEIKKAQTIERHMEKALDRSEFFVVYQPKISLKDEKIKGAEALVRWASSDQQLGFLSPADFIPIFERNGFIVKLDFEVYEMVFKFLRKQLDLGNPVVPISVNMSRNHKNPDKFVKEFIKRFQKYDLPPELIEIEIIERSLDTDSTNLSRVTELLHQEGFTVAMDDFGSGQSSLNMLTEVPIDVLKFDQNFLREKSDDTNRTNMIHTLITLGKQLNKKTLFEGVETIEQKELLKDLECDQVQGYFYSKPLEEKDFVEFVKKYI